MPNLNKVMLMGYLTRDPEIRVTPKGTSICQFGIAINRSFKLESGETREEVVFVDVEAWGKAGETISKYVGKGKPLYVEGRLKLDQWEDKNTHEKKSRMKVVLEQFQFLGSKDSAAETESPPRTAYPPRSGTRTENLDEDVPF